MAFFLSPVWTDLVQSEPTERKRKDRADAEPKEVLKRGKRNHSVVISQHERQNDLKKFSLESLFMDYNKTGCHKCSCLLP